MVKLDITQFPEIHLSPTQIAYYYPITLRAIYKAISSGELKAIKWKDPKTFQGYRLCVPMSSLAMFLEEYVNK